MLSYADLSIRVLSLPLLGTQQGAVEVLRS